MNQRRFGKTGFQVSPLGFGGATIGFLKTDQDQVTRILNSLLDAGVNVIDTAAYYQGSEQSIGDAVSQRRDEYVLVSKCGTKIPESPAAPFSPELIAASVERSLRNLKTDHLDVMLLHSCDLATLKQCDALAALVRARDAGKIRFVGYSGDNEAAAYAATLPDIAVIETSISITDQANIDTVLPVAKQNDIGIIAKRPIANAAWKRMEDQPEYFRAYTQPYADRLKQMQLKIETLLRSPATADANPWPELALRFTLAQDIHTAIIGTTSPDHAKANIAIAKRGPLASQSVEQIRNAFRRADPQHQWLGET